MNSFSRLVFMGTPSFAVPALQALLDHDYNVLAVVTQPDRPKGRGRKLTPPPVKEAALQHGLEILQPEKASSPDFCEAIRARNPDLLVVLAFGQILRKPLLQIPAWGALNIHGSLLPKYRGAAPIQWAILNQERITGLTAMRMDEGVDTGPIFLHKEVAILSDETYGHLQDRLADFAGKFLIETLRALSEGRVEEREQDHTLATMAPKIERDMGLIRWEEPAGKISALIRALDPWPGAFTIVKGREVKVFSARLVREDGLGTVPGRVMGVGDRGICLETGRGLLEIGVLQLQGKKRLPAREFVKGFSVPPGTVFGV
jgi:methionyl-tRNA formyltransferase